MIETNSIDRNLIDELLESLGGDRAFLNDLIDTSLADSPALLTDMKQALEAGDADRFRRTAHTLKSSSASLGAMTLSAMAKELEWAGKSGALEGVRERLIQASAEFERVRVELDTYRGAGGG